MPIVNALIESTADNISAQVASGIIEAIKNFFKGNLPEMMENIRYCVAAPLRDFESLQPMIPPDRKAETKEAAPVAVMLELSSTALDVDTTGKPITKLSGNTFNNGTMVFGENQVGRELQKAADALCQWGAKHDKSTKNLYIVRKLFILWFCETCQRISSGESIRTPLGQDLIKYLEAVLHWAMDSPVFSSNSTEGSLKQQCATALAHIATAHMAARQLCDAQAGVQIIERAIGRSRTILHRLNKWMLTSLSEVRIPLSLDYTTLGSTKTSVIPSVGSLMRPTLINTLLQAISQQVFGEANHPLSPTYNKYKSDIDHLNDFISKLGGKRVANQKTVTSIVLEKHEAVHVVTSDKHATKDSRSKAIIAHETLGTDLFIQNLKKIEFLDKGKYARFRVSDSKSVSIPTNFAEELIEGDLELMHSIWHTQIKTLECTNTFIYLIEMYEQLRQYARDFGDFGLYRLASETVKEIMPITVKILGQLQTNIVSITNIVRNVRFTNLSACKGDVSPARVDNLRSTGSHEEYLVRLITNIKRDILILSAEFQVWHSRKDEEIRPLAEAKELFEMFSGLTSKLHEMGIPFQPTTVKSIREFLDASWPNFGMPIRSIDNSKQAEVKLETIVRPPANEPMDIGSTSPSGEIEANPKIDLQKACVSFRDNLRSFSGVPGGNLAVKRKLASNAIALFIADLLDIKESNNLKRIEFASAMTNSKEEKGALSYKHVFDKNTGNPFLTELLNSALMQSFRCAISDCRKTKDSKSSLERIRDHKLPLAQEAESIPYELVLTLTVSAGLYHLAAKDDSRRGWKPKRLINFFAALDKSPLREQLSYIGKEFCEALYLARQAFEVPVTARLAETPDATPVSSNVGVSTRKLSDTISSETLPSLPQADTVVTVALFESNGNVNSTVLSSALTPAVMELLEYFKLDVSLLTQEGRGCTEKTNKNSSDARRKSSPGFFSTLSFSSTSSSLTTTSPVDDLTTISEKNKKPVASGVAPELR